MNQPVGVRETWSRRLCWLWIYGTSLDSWYLWWPMATYGEQECLRALLGTWSPYLSMAGHSPIHRGSFHISTDEKKKERNQEEKNQTS